MNPKVDFFFNKDEKWHDAFEELRAIVLDCGLDEHLKWGNPCYTLEDRNIVLIHGFKEYCALLVFKGALLKDPKGILVQQTENVQAARQIRFTSAQQIVKLKTTLKAYIKEAIKVEASGEKVVMKKTKEYEVPEEFQTRLSKTPGLKKAFAALTPGRQRGYLLYFSSAKQAKTREARIENIFPRSSTAKASKTKAIAMAKTKKQSLTAALSQEQSEALASILKKRFNQNKAYHKGLDWDAVDKKLKANLNKLWSLHQMETTGGEPDVIGFDKKTGEYIFCDCSAESPKGRRSLCYDREALDERKEHKPASSALDVATDMGIEILTEDQYRDLQKLGEFDLKTSSWIQTPDAIRTLGGALFCDRRYNTVFTYHNGASSYYAARGFRGILKV